MIDHDEDIQNKHAIAIKSISVIEAPNPFEGPEKLLEIWFSDSANNLPASASPNGLLAVDIETWRTMLELVNCQILSTISNDQVIAHLLSESSMFIFPHKLILKTCGTTTLLLGLSRILEVAADEAGFPCEHSHPIMRSKAAKTVQVFYSRRNFLCPQKQRGPHGSWFDEIKCLNQYFANGNAYAIGKLNRDHWHLYITNRNGLKVDSPTMDERNVNHVTKQEDQTIEILMKDLDPGLMRVFYHEEAKRLHSRRIEGDEASGHSLGAFVADYCGLSNVFSCKEVAHSAMDSFLFEPCGFSANNIFSVSNQLDNAYYYTIHVTPEPECSYASFETNLPSKFMAQGYEKLISQVTDIFGPQSFSVSIFNAKYDDLPFIGNEYGRKVDELNKYRRTDNILHDLEVYDLSYQCFELV